MAETQVQEQKGRKILLAYFEKIDNSVASCFTKDDVKNLLETVINDLSKGESFGEFTLEDFYKRLKDVIPDVIRNMSDDEIVDTGNVCFDISNGNEIEVSNWEIEYDSIVDNVINCIDEEFMDFQETHG